MKKLIMLVAGIMIFSNFFAQKGFLRGRIIDGASGEPLTGTTIVIPGTTTGVISDLDGDYSIELTPGNYTINVSFISYKTRIFEGIMIKAGEVTELNITLSPATTDIQEIVVVGKMQKKTESAVQIVQKKSPSVLDGISSQQISRLGDSDAAGALKRVTGISVQDGKYIYVRGLSDRYMRVTLNGAQIPGLDPNFNTVQMDLFPSNIIENIMVTKTYTPDLPSFTGGLVNLETRDFPTHFTLQATTGYGFNTLAHFHDHFLTYPGGDMDWLGISDSKRDIPGPAKNVEIPYINQETVGLVNKISRSFNQELKTSYATAPLNQNYSLSFGNQIPFENSSSLGYIAALSYRLESTYYNNARLDDYEASTSTAVSPSELLSGESGQADVLWSALVGLNYKLNLNTKLGVMLLRNQNGQKTGRYNVGSIKESDDFPVQKWSLEYLERSMTVGQLKGEHAFPGLGNAKLEWITSYTLSRQNEPDLRFFTNELSVTDDDTIYFVAPNRKPERRYRMMSESNWDSRFDLTIPFDFLGGKSKLKAGVGYLGKHRNADENRFTINTLNAVNYNGDPSTYTNPENIVNENNYSNAVYYDNDFFTNGYLSIAADDNISSGYFMLDFPFISKFRMVAGLRAEHENSLIENKIDTLVFTRSSQKSKYIHHPTENLDILPSINLVYRLSENMNVRMAFSKSVTRPSFKERAPYAYYEFTWSTTQQGNPGLKRGVIDNYDLRWEYFFNYGEMVSASAFYKEITDPIERIKSSQTGNLMLFENGSNAFLYGFEFDLRKNLDFIRALRGFQFGTNFSWIYSQTDVDPDRLEAARTVVPDFPSKRPLYGQAPYIVNAFLGYTNNDIGLDANLGFNIEGPKIVLINKFQTPDVYEQPFPNLNFTLTKNILKKFEVSVSGKNLLDHEFRQIFTMKDGTDYSYRTHFLGRTFKAGVSYKFD